MGTESPESAPAPAGGGGGGWTFLKVVGVAFGVIAMLGFGLCSLCGLVLGFGGGFRDIGVFLAYSIPGLLLAWLAFLLVRKIIRSTR